MKGYVYIVTNPAFREDWVKIGKTEKDVEERINALYTTALPLKFELYAWCRTEKYSKLEKQMHFVLEKLADKRVNEKREFFNVVPSEALSLLRLLASTIDDAEFYVPGEDVEIAQHAKPAPSFRFSMVKLLPGDELIFEPTGVKVLVSDKTGDNKIEYKGEPYTLSGFCKKFMPENKRNKSGAYQGPQYFSYDGELLVRLREKYENE
jgi:hypothetical protein